MADGAQSDIREILGEIQSCGPLMPSHKSKMNALMRHFQAAGLTLATCADARHLCRSVSTLQGYARDLALAFPDYVPMALRPPKPPKARKRSQAA
jgi:hypothetical protein